MKPRMEILRTEDSTSVFKETGGRKRKNGKRGGGGKKGTGLPVPTSDARPDFSKREYRDSDSINRAARERLNQGSEEKTACKVRAGDELGISSELSRFRRERKADESYKRRKSAVLKRILLAGGQEKFGGRIVNQSLISYSS